MTCSGATVGEGLEFCIFISADAIAGKTETSVTSMFFSFYVDLISFYIQRNGAAPLFLLLLSEFFRLTDKSTI